MTTTPTIGTPLNKQVLLQDQRLRSSYNNYDLEFLRQPPIPRSSTFYAEHLSKKAEVLVVDKEECIDYSKFEQLYPTRKVQGETMPLTTIIIKTSTEPNVANEASIIDMAIDIVQISLLSLWILLRL